MNSIPEKEHTILTPNSKSKNNSQKILRSLEPQNDIRISIMQTVPAENLIRGLLAASRFVKTLGDGEYDLLLEISKRDDTYDSDK